MRNVFTMLLSCLCIADIIFIIRQVYLDHNIVSPVSGLHRPYSTQSRPGHSLLPDQVLYRLYTTECRLAV